jgi:hypothetical protein
VGATRPESPNLSEPLNHWNPVHRQAWRWRGPLAKAQQRQRIRLIWPNDRPTFPLRDVQAWRLFFLFTVKLAKYDGFPRSPLVPRFFSRACFWASLWLADHILAFVLYLRSRCSSVTDRFAKQGITTYKGTAGRDLRIGKGGREKSPCGFVVDSPRSNLTG